MQSKWISVVLKILVHALVIVMLYVAFSFSLFLGLQVRPLYGNAGVITVFVLVVLYVYFGWIRPIVRKKSRTSIDA